MPTVDAVTMAIYRSSVFFMFLAPCIQKREGETEGERERGGEREGETEREREGEKERGRERGGKEKEATALNWNFCFIPNLHNLFLAKGIVRA